MLPYLPLQPNVQPHNNWHNYLFGQTTGSKATRPIGWGIVALAMFASLLVIMFDATTTRLIPLYAVGVFLSFTLSQTGMVIRARRIGKLKPGESAIGLETDLEHDVHWKKHMVISGIGAVSTFVVMIVFAVTKFTSGAWFIVILIPTLVFIFFRIHHHYKEVAVKLSKENVEPVKKYGIQTLLLVDNVHAQTVRLVNFAKALDNPWKAVHIGISPEKAEIVKQRWQERIGEGTLEIIDSP